MRHAMSPFYILKSLDLLGWLTLLVGWERGWATKSDLEHYATDKLQNATCENDLVDTAILASAKQLDNAEIGQSLKQLAENTPERSQEALEKWRLARLIALQSQGLDWDEKVTRLEEIGADFGFPEDMRNCSRYAISDEATDSDPLESMANVIVGLRKHFGVG